MHQMLKSSFNTRTFPANFASVKTLLPNGPRQKKLRGFLYSIKSEIPGAQPLSLAIRGQNIADFHFGIMSTPFALHMMQ